MPLLAPQYPALAVQEQESQQSCGRKQGRRLHQYTREGRGKQQHGDGRFPGHPGSLGMKEYVQETPRTADLQPHQEQSQAHEYQCGQADYQVRRARPGRDGGHEDQGAAAAAEHEIARGAPVPLGLQYIAESVLHGLPEFYML